VAIAVRYKGYRYRIEVIGHAVWLYHRFALSLRDVEDETIRLARAGATVLVRVRQHPAALPDPSSSDERARMEA